MKLNKYVLNTLFILILISAIVLVFYHWNFYFTKKVELGKFNFANKWNQIKKTNNIKDNTAFISRNNTSGFEMLIDKDSKLYLKYSYLEFTLLNNSSASTLNTYRLDEHDTNYKLLDKLNISSNLSEPIPLSVDKLASILDSININKLIESLKISDLCLLRYDGIIVKGTTLNSIDKNTIIIDKNTKIDYKSPYFLMKNGVKFTLATGSNMNGVSELNITTVIYILDELVK